MTKRTEADVTMQMLGVKNLGIELGEARRTSWRMRALTVAAVLAFVTLAIAGWLLIQ